VLVEGISFLGNQKQQDVSRRILLSRQLEAAGGRQGLHVHFWKSSKYIAPLCSKARNQVSSCNNLADFLPLNFPDFVPGVPSSIFISPNVIRNSLDISHRISTFRTSPERGNSYLFHYLAHSVFVCFKTHPSPPLPVPVRIPPPYMIDFLPPPISSPPIHTPPSFYFCAIKICLLVMLYFTANKY